MGMRKLSAFSLATVKRESFRRRLTGEVQKLGESGLTDERFKIPLLWEQIPQNSLNAWQSKKLTFSHSGT